MTFYKLEIGRERPFVEATEANQWESVRCPTYEGHRRAGRRITDLSLDVISGNVVDFSRTALSDIVISDHALHEMRSAKLSGFTTRPVVISGVPKHVDGSKLPTLSEFVVVGRAGRAHSDSGIVKLRECGECGLVEYSAFKHGIVVNASSYDGSDFFTVVEYPKFVLVTERAKSVIEDSRLTNASFMESTRLQWPRGVVQPL